MCSVYFVEFSTNIRPPVSEAFKKQFTHPPTNAGRGSPVKADGAPGTSFRYTTSAHGKREDAQPDQSKTDDTEQRKDLTSPNTF